MAENVVGIRITSDGRAFVVDQAANAKAVQGLGQEVETAGKKADKASASIGELQRQNAAMVAGSKAATAGLQEQGYAAQVLAQQQVKAADAADAFIAKLQRQADQVGKTKSEILAMEAAQHGVSDAAAPYIAKMEQAANSTHSLSLATSGVTRELAVMGGEAMRGNWTRLEGSMTVLANRTGLMQSAITGMASPLGIFLTLVAAAAVATGALAVQHEHLQQQLNRTGVQFEYAGSAANFSHQQIREMIDTVASMPGVTSEAAAKVVDSFAHIRDQSAETIRSAILDTNDLAVALGVKAPEAAKQLAHALADPTAGVRELDAALNFLTASQVVQIEQMVKMGDRAGAASLLFAALHDHIKGAADEALTPFQHAMQDLTVEWDRFNHTAESTNGVSQWQTLISGVIKDVTWLIANLPRADEAVAHMASRQARGMHYGLPQDAGDTSAGGVDDFTPAIAPKAVVPTGPGSAVDIDARTKAIIEQNKALESAAQKEAEYQAKLNAIDALIQENTRLHGENGEAVKRLEEIYQAEVEKHNKLARAGMRDGVNAQLEELKRGDLAQQEEVKENIAHIESLVKQGVITEIDAIHQETAARLAGIDAHEEVLKRELAIAKKNKDSKVEQARINGEIGQAESQRRTVTEQETDRIAAAVKKEADAREAAYNKSMAAGEAEILAITQRADVIEQEIAMRGKSAQAILDVANARDVEKRAALEEFDAGAAADRIDQINREIEARKRLIADLNTKDAITAADASAKHAEEAWTHTEHSIEEGLYSAVTDGIGSAGKKALKDLENWAAHLLLQIPVQAIGQFGASLLNPGAASAAGGAGNLLGLASNGTSLYNGASTLWNGGSLSNAGGIVGAFSQGASGAAAIGTGSSFASTVGGGLATDAMGAGVAEGAAAAGIETGIGAGVEAGLAAVPVYGWIALAGMALWSAFGGQGGGPKTEGGFAPGGMNIAGTDIGGSQQGSQRGDVATAQQLAQGISSGIDQVASAFGIKLADQVGLFFAKDPEGTSMTQLQVTSADYNRSDVAGGIENVGRSDQAFQDAYMLSAAQAVLAALQKAAQGGELKGELGDFVKAISANGTADQINAAIKLAENAQAMYAAFGKLGPQFTSFTDMTVEDMGKLVDSLGGIANATQDVNAWFNDFYTDAEKRTMAIDQVVKILNAAGLQVTADQIANATHAQVRAYGDWLASIGNTQGFAALMSVADALNTIVPAANAAATAITDETAANAAAQASAMSAVDAAHQELIASLQSEASTLAETVTRFRDFARNIRDFRDSLLTSDISPLTPQQKYEEAKKEFEATLAAANAGDATAQGQLQGVAQTFLEMSRNYFASSDQYTADFQEVQQALTAVANHADATADVAKLQLDVANNQLAALEQNVQATVSVATAINDLSAAVLAAIAAGANPGAANVGALTGGVTGQWVPSGAGDAYESGGGAAALNNGSGTTIYGKDGQSYTMQQAVDFIHYAAAQGNAQAIYDKAKSVGITLSEVDSIAGWAPMTAENWATANNLPIFGDGGWHAGGWAVVGDRGPELAYMPPARIYSNSESRSMLGGGDGAELLRELQEVNRRLESLENTFAEGATMNAAATHDTGKQIAAGLITTLNLPVHKMKLRKSAEVSI
jgi:hypothetical protein